MQHGDFFPQIMRKWSPLNIEGKRNLETRDNITNHCGSLLITIPEFSHIQRNFCSEEWRIHFILIAAALIIALLLLNISLNISPEKRGILLNLLAKIWPLMLKYRDSKSLLMSWQVVIFLTQL